MTAHDSFTAEHVAIAANRTLCELKEIGDTIHLATLAIFVDNDHDAGSDFLDAAAERIRFASHQITAALSECGLA